MMSEESEALHNWNAFWDFHLGAWNGRWTRYQPTGELSETFLSRRTFRSSHDRKIINQSNQYFYQDGQQAEKVWQYTIQDHCQRDGFMHPASDYMRGLAFANGAAAWLVPQAKPDQYFPMELFLANQDSRHSVGMLYELNGELQRTACIREHRNDLGTSCWSESVRIIPSWNIGSDWYGSTEVIDTDLHRSSFKDTFNMTLQTDEIEYFFPDNIILRCPKKLSLGRPFTVSSIWLETQNKLKTITATYGHDSKLIDVRLQNLSR